MLYKFAYVKLCSPRQITKKIAVYWPARSSLAKSKPECRYAAFTENNYLIINTLYNNKQYKNNSSPITA
jgi:hypothetical protein